MAQPAEEATGVANVFIIGTTGSGKSTLANLLVYGDDAPEHGFAVGDGADSETSELKSVTSKLGACVVQVTDTPGVPDTDRKKSLLHYDNMIKYLRQAPWINAIIIMVAEGRKDERVYRDMRALMKQFNTLPCGKIMVFRSSLPPRCSDERRRTKDRLAEQAMDKLLEAAGLSFAMKCVLHDMDGNEVQNLRNLVCNMPATRIGELRTYGEIRADFKELSDQNSRTMAVEREVGRLRTLKAENEKTRERLTARIAGLERKERTAKVASGFLGLGFGGIVSAVVDLTSNLPDLRGEKAHAEARVRAVSEDITRKQKELDDGRVDQEELAKAKAEFDELDILSRG